MLRVRTQTRSFDINVQAGAMSDHDNVCGMFKDILNYASARIELRGLEQSSFLYDLPDDGLARISGYLHTNNRFLLTEAAVQGWILDDRIKGDVQWTPIHPGKNGDWKQEPLNGAHQRHLGCLRRWHPSPRGLGGQQLG